MNGAVPSLFLDWPRFRRARHRSFRLGATGLATAAMVLQGCTSEPEIITVPTLSDATPDTLIVGSATAVLTLMGRDFASSARAQWNGTDLPTTAGSATRLKATVDGNLLTTPGEAQVTVFNPGVGGGTSQPILVTVAYDAPVLQSISPATVYAGSPDVTLTLQGSGFAAETEVYLNNSVRPPVISVSPAEMRVLVHAEYLWDGGQIQVKAWNPQPGGGHSDIRLLTVANPVPGLASITPNTASADTTSIVTAVIGSGFTGATTLTVGGYVVHPEFISPTELRLQLNPGFFPTGQLPIVAVNPAPGGGASAPIWFTVGYGKPRIKGAIPSTAVVGSPSVLVTLSGTHFSPGSSVKWNGSLRGSSRLDDSTLRFTIFASDLIQAMTGTVEVTTPVGTSAPLYFPVVPAVAGTPQETSVAQRFEHIVYDPLRGRIWGSIPADAATRPNTIVAVDPFAGEITDVIALPGDPGRVAISSDAHYLYVALRSTPAVARIDLTTGAKDLEFGLGTDAIGRPFYAGDIEVPAGMPETVVATLRRTAEWDYLGALAYDNGIPRGTIDLNGYFVSRLTAGPSPTRFYGFTARAEPFRVPRFTLEPTGLRHDDEYYSVNGEIDGDIAFGGGLLYITNGTQLDPERMVTLGSFNVSGPVCPDAPHGKVYYHAGGEIHVFHYLTRAALGHFAVAGGTASTSLARWGSDGLALVTASSLVLVRSNLIGN